MENFLITRVDKNLPLPMRQSEQASGFDLYSTMDAVLQPMQRVLLPTGIKIALPRGFEAQIRPRSGLAVKHGITCVNAPGTVDADYRGEIHVSLINLGHADFHIKRGDRIAQMIIARVEMCEFTETDTLPDSIRGEGRFGSTGT